MGWIRSHHGTGRDGGKSTSAQGWLPEEGVLVFCQVYGSARVYGLQYSVWAVFTIVWCVFVLGLGLGFGLQGPY